MRRITQTHIPMSFKQLAYGYQLALLAGRRIEMKTKLLALTLLAGGTMFAETRFSIGVNLGGYGGGYYEPTPYVTARPPCPGPDYAWTDGYWSQDYGRRSWHEGYWARQSFREYQAQPRYDGRVYDGYGSYNRQRDRGDYERRQNQNQSFRRDRDDDRDNRGRDHRQDDRHGNGNQYGYGNGYRGR